MEAWEKFEKLIDRLGAQEICDELEQYLSSDDLENFVEHLQDSFDIDDEDLEEDYE